MTLRFDPCPPAIHPDIGAKPVRWSHLVPGIQGDNCRGVSLFEILLVLALLAAVTAVAFPALRNPSAALAAARRAATWSDRFAAARDRAVRDTRITTLDLTDAACDATLTTATFFPDGTVASPDLCVTSAGILQRLHANPLTGRLYRLPAP